MILNPTLGYGTYRWTVDGPLPTLDPNVMLAITSEDSPRCRLYDLQMQRPRRIDEWSGGVEDIRTRPYWSRRALHCPLIAGESQCG